MKKFKLLRCGIIRGSVLVPPCVRVRAEERGRGEAEEARLRPCVLGRAASSHLVVRPPSSEREAQSGGTEKEETNESKPHSVTSPSEERRGGRITVRE